MKEKKKFPRLKTDIIEYMMSSRNAKSDETKNRWVLGTLLNFDTYLVGPRTEKT